MSLGILSREPWSPYANLPRRLPPVDFPGRNRGQSRHQRREMERRIAPSAGEGELPSVLKGDSVSLYRTSKPLGDALFITTVARELRRRKPSLRVHVKTHWPALFVNNPDVASVAAIREPFVPDGGFPIVYEEPWPPPRRRHVLQTICERLGLDGPLEARTYYPPTEGERQRAEEIRPPDGRPLVVVHPF